MKMARGLGWGPLVLPALSGDRVGYMTVWQGGRKGVGELGRGGRGVEGASGEVSGQVGELDEGEGEGRRCGW